jgi:conjugal transfer pilus assembly protein TraF
MRAAAVLLLLILLSAVTAFAGCKPYDEFYRDAERGWFWYEICPEDATDNDTEETPKYRYIPQKVYIPWEELDKIDPDDINKIETENRKIAMMYPDDYNLIEYKNLIAWITNKSTVYSRADTAVRTKYPETVEFALNKPTNTWAQDIASLENKRLTKETLGKYVETIGLVVFATETCPYCAKQQNIMEMFKRDYEIEYRYAYISESPEIAAQFGINTVPDIFILAEIEGKPVWQRISTGLTSYDELEKAVFLGLILLGEEIDEKLAY